MLDKSSNKTARQQKSKETESAQEQHRMSNKIDSFQISLNKRIFRPVDVIVCSIKFQVKQRVKINFLRVDIEGQGSIKPEGISTIDAKQGISGPVKQKFLDISHTLATSVTLDPDFYSFSYKFSLPITTNFPLKLEQARGYALVSYLASAKIELDASTSTSSDKMVEAAECSFDVINKIDLNLYSSNSTSSAYQSPLCVTDVLNLPPVVETTRPGPNNSNHGIVGSLSTCFNTKQAISTQTITDSKSCPVFLNFGIDKSSYKIGEDILFKVTLTNQSNSRVRVELSVQLIQQVNLLVRRSSTITDSSVLKELYDTMSFRELAPNSTDQWEANFVIPDWMMPTVTTSTSQIVQIDYLFACKLKPSGSQVQPIDLVEDLEANKLTLPIQLTLDSDLSHKYATIDSKKSSILKTTSFTTSIVESTASSKALQAVSYTSPIYDDLVYPTNRLTHLYKF